MVNDMSGTSLAMALAQQTTPSVESAIRIACLKDREGSVALTGDIV